MCLFFSTCKTKERSIVKAESDYKHKSWPHTKHIMDILRCSVTFDTIEDLINGFKKFKQNRLNCARTGNYGQGCLRNITRIKNGFAEINDESWKLDLSSFDYCDIKFNVVVRPFTSKSNDILFAEIQFLAKFMLDAKKLGHSIYSFNRKENLIKNLSNNCNTHSHLNRDDVDDNVKRMIFSQNLSQFSIYLETVNHIEWKYILSKKDVFMEFIQLNKWSKGATLFQSFVH